MLLKLIGTSSLVLKNNPKLFKKDIFSIVLIPYILYQNFLIGYQNYLHLLMINTLHVYLLKNNG